MERSGKKLAVIILNWNGLELLKRFIPAAVEYTIDEDTDLIVADNGSADGSLEWLMENHPEVIRLPFPRNHGFAEGYNLAIEATGYPYTILLNSDVEVTPGWTRPLLRLLEDDPSVGACQPKIRSLRDRSKFEYAGAAGGYLDRLGYPYCRGRLFDSIETDSGQYDGKPVQIGWASGAALAVNTAHYTAAGGLDPLFFAHMEEIDLCCRMQAMGLKVMAVSDSMVYHLGGASLDASNPKKTYLNFRNNLLLLYKNTPEGKGRTRLFVRRLTDTLAFLMFLAKGRWRHARAILSAHNDFRSMRRNYTVFPEQEFLSTMPGAKRNILIDYYIKRQKR